MFEPPRCPYPACAMHHSPVPGFFRRKGFYRPKCRAHPVPRFCCRHCKQGFSRQTFRMDYRDHRPDLNAALFMLLAAGLGLRQSARLLQLSRNCTAQKFRKLARHLRRQNRNLRGPLPAGSSLQLDELETYEGRRGTRPLTLPLVIERQSRFIIAARAAPIRPSGAMTPARLRAVAADEARFKRRPSRSRPAVRAVLRRAAALCREQTTVLLETDEKSTYPNLARAAFGAERLVHATTNSRLARMTWNPLFPINHTEAMARDLNGRLRRESWLVSKLRWFLNLQLELFAAYRNFVRRRFNRDKESPAQLLGFVDQRMRPTQLLSWRQDWDRRRSIHPLARRGETVEQWMDGGPR
jgi:transposase-like protein